MEAADVRRRDPRRAGELIVHVLSKRAVIDCVGESAVLIIELRSSPTEAASDNSTSARNLLHCPGAERMIAGSFFRPR